MIRHDTSSIRDVNSSTNFCTSRSTFAPCRHPSPPAEVEVEEEEAAGVESGVEAGPILSTIFLPRSTSKSRPILIRLGGLVRRPSDRSHAVRPRPGPIRDRFRSVPALILIRGH